MLKKELTQPFFATRMVEMFDKKSLDSYKVRYHNSLTLFEELTSMLKAWMKGRLQKFSTVSNTAEELRSSLKIDQFVNWSYYSKNSFIDDLKELCSPPKGENNIDVKKWLFLVNQLIVLNKDKYFNNLISFIEDELNSDIEIDSDNMIGALDPINQAISFMGTELVHRGYSKSHIYFVSKKFVETMGEDFMASFQNFKKCFTTSQSHKYVCIFPLKHTSAIDDEKGAMHPQLLTEIPTDYINDYLKNNYPKQISSGNNKRFFICDIVALDVQSAIKKARELLLTVLDQVHIIQNQAIFGLPDNCFIGKVVEKKDIIWQYRNADYRIDSELSIISSISDAYAFERFVSVLTSGSIKQDAKERFTNALRHIRIANSVQEIEQRFINYWIALEFIYSAPESSEHTIKRLEEYLPTILTNCYVKRNLLDLSNQLSVCLSKEVNLLEAKLEDIDVLFNEVPSILLKYRLKKIKSQLWANSDDSKAYVNRHKTNLIRHIIRIYRYRNELIHEAAINQDIEALTSNLRDYLIMTINQLFAFFERQKDNTNRPINVDDFFYEAQYRFKSIVDEKYSLKSFLSVPLSIGLLH